MKVKEKKVLLRIEKNFLFLIFMIALSVRMLENLWSELPPVLFWPAMYYNAETVVRTGHLISDPSFTEYWYSRVLHINSLPLAGTNILIAIISLITGLSTIQIGRWFILGAFEILPAYILVKELTKSKYASWGTAIVIAVIPYARLYSSSGVSDASITHILFLLMLYSFLKAFKKPDRRWIGLVTLSLFAITISYYTSMYVTYAAFIGICFVYAIAKALNYAIDLKLKTYPYFLFLASLIFFYQWHIFTQLTGNVVLPKIPHLFNFQLWAQKPYAYTASQHFVIYTTLQLVLLYLPATVVFAVYAAKGIKKYFKTKSLTLTAPRLICLGWTLGLLATAFVLYTTNTWKIVVNYGPQLAAVLIGVGFVKVFNRKKMYGRVLLIAIISIGIFSDLQLYFSPYYFYANYNNQEYQSLTWIGIYVPNYGTIFTDLRMGEYIVAYSGKQNTSGPILKWADGLVPIYYSSDPDVAYGFLNGSFNYFVVTMDSVYAGVVPWGQTLEPMPIEALSKFDQKHFNKIYTNGYVIIYYISKCL
jgi:hypothetical protein